MSALTEMQFARVAFARFAEELEGGYPDQNLSSEIDRFFNVLKAMRDVSDNRDFLKIQVETRGNAGVLSRLFGEKHVPREDSSIDPAKADALLGDVMEAEVLDD